MKQGLNRSDVSKYHNMLKEEVPLKSIARSLHTTVDVLKRLSPAKMEAADKAAKEAKIARIATNRENAQKAKVLAQTAANIMADVVPGAGTE